MAQKIVDSQAASPHDPVHAMVKELGITHAVAAELLKAVK
jgi:hypothetical protein